METGEKKMKKHIWLAAGIAGMLLAIPPGDAKAAIDINISTGNRPSFIINSPPSFIYLRTQGFSVSVGSPYDIVYYGNRYYIYHNGRWYRSYYYRGPWVLILDAGLPYQIRRYRDIEYRRPDSRNNQYQRNDDNRRRVLDQRSDANNRKLQLQQNTAPQARPNQAVQNIAPQQRQIQSQQNAAPQQRQNQGQQNVAPQQRQNQGQQNKAPQRQNQGQQNIAPQQRQIQSQQNAAPQQRQIQSQQNKAPQQRQNQGQQNKGAENKKGKDQSNKEDKGKKN